MEYTLLKNKLDNKIYTFNGNNFIETNLIEPLTKLDFVNNGIINIDIITELQWSALPINDIEVIVWSNKTTNVYLSLTSKSSFITIETFSDPQILTWANTGKDIQVKINADIESHIKLIISKDNRFNWYGFDGNTFSPVSLNNIATQGMTKTQLNNISSTQWDGWFERGYLDFAIYISTQNPLDTPLVRSIIVDFPKNSAPVVNDFIITPNVIFRNSINMSANIRDLEGDPFRYQVLLNGKNSGWSNWYDGLIGCALYETYEYTEFKYGENEIIIKVQDDRGVEYSSPPKFVKLMNNAPIISSFLYDNWSLKGVIVDSDGDDIKYRVLINGLQKYPITNDQTSTTYTEWITTPYDLHYEWSPYDLIFGQANKITVEIQDKVGEIYKVDITDVVGKYRNIMFKSEDGKYLTNDMGELINWGNNIYSYLQFEDICTEETSKSKKVIIENDFGYAIDNVKVYVNNNLNNGYEVQLSKDNNFIENGSDTLEELLFSDVLNDNDIKDFYVRVKAKNVIESSTNEIFEFDVVSKKV